MARGLAIDAESGFFEGDAPQVSAGGDKQGLEIGSTESAVGDFVVWDGDEVDESTGGGEDVDASWVGLGGFVGEVVSV
jgi:hypothetical protein